jgi:hypothetical protein
MSGWLLVYQGVGLDGIHPRNCGNEKSTGEI